MGSVWTDTTVAPGFEPLRGELKTDVLIVGGGMAGILCAHALHERGVDYALVEAKQIGSGITANTTAKVTSQHGLIYDRLIREAGADKARQYLRANETAVERFRALARDIPCDWEDKPAFVYSRDDRPAVEREAEAVRKLGGQADVVSEIPLPIEIQGAVCFERQAQFHPLKFLYGLARGLNIYENTFIRTLEGTAAQAERGSVAARRVVAATHFPFLNRHGSYFLKLYQHRSYVVALENAPDVGGMYVDNCQTGLSFRNHDGLLFVGGGDHRTGDRGGHWAELRAFARQEYPGASERYAWATQDCMSLDGVPYVGRYSRSTPDLYVAAGFNKWGMTGSMTAAMILADLLTDGKSEYAEVFSPSRSMLNRQLGANGGHAVKNLLCRSPKRCTHMGCALRWNTVENTWDCPCHGSRYDADGNVLNNPAMKGLKS
jgi:glycine/D-amino acid oxidase-like deaminating enzyme